MVTGVHKGDVPTMTWPAPPFMTSTPDVRRQLRHRLLEDLEILSQERIQLTSLVSPTDGQRARLAVVEHELGRIKHGLESTI